MCWVSTWATARSVRPPSARGCEWRATPATRASSTRWPRRSGSCAGDSRAVRCAARATAWSSRPTGSNGRASSPNTAQGKKHSRSIVLESWQRALVELDPRGLLRGLLQTDGWRGLNKVRVKGRDYAYPRYQFSSRSDDIRRIFTDTCDLLGIAWRPWGRWHISVARRDSVALLDEFVGPKT